MARFVPDWVAHQRRHFLRHDAHRFLRHDWQRFVKPGAALSWPLSALVEAKANFDPSQPRVPAGHPDGGQWTDEQGKVGETPDDTAVDPSDFEDAITEFSAVGKTRGHHLVPQAHYKDLPLLRETRKVFDEATTGPIRLKTTSEDGLLRGHYWDGPNGAHGQYSEAVGRLLRNYLSENGIEPRQMTPGPSARLSGHCKGIVRPPDKRLS